MMPMLPQSSTPPTPSLLAMLTPVQSGDAGDAGAFDRLVAAQTTVVVSAAPVVDVVRRPAPAARATIADAEAAPTTAPAASQMQAVQAPSAKSALPSISVRAELVEAPSFSSTPQEINPAPFDRLAGAQDRLRPAQGERLLGIQSFLSETMPTIAEAGADIESKAVESPDAHISDPAPEAKPEATATDKTFLATSELLATLAQFTAPTPKQAPAKQQAATAEGDGETRSDGKTAGEGDVAVAPEARALLPLAVAIPTTVEARPAAKPAPEAVHAAAPRRDEAQALSAAVPKARDAAAPHLSSLAAERTTPKPAADAAMTVLFAQGPAAPGATPVGAPGAVATIAERVLDLSSDEAWIEQLAADIAATKSASNEVSFRLMPRHLGRLDVSMLIGDEGVSLKLETQHEATATIVTAGQVRLVDELRQQGVRVAEAQVTHSPADQGRQSPHGQGRSPAQDAAHRIETATEREPREAGDRQLAGNRRGRFA